MCGETLLIVSHFLRLSGLLTAAALALASTAKAQVPLVAPVPPPVVIAAPPAEVALRPDQVERLARALTQADSHGLSAAAFAPEAALALIGARDPEQRRAGQARLVVLTLRYAKAVHAGRLNTPDFILDWGLRPAAYDPWTDFTTAVAQDRIGPWLDGLPPPYAGYQTLQRGLATYRALAARGGWRPVTGGPPLKPGMADPRVGELRRRLAVEDAAVAVEGPNLYDPALVEAVMRAQKRFGLDPDGGLGPQTLAALNVPVQRRIDQILANMERWRWLPPVLPADRLQVNIAAAVMTVFQADRPTLSMRAVTGRPGDETPMLASKIHSIVLNPPWNVPASIAAKELWPKERAHPGYLRANDFVVIPTGDGGSRLQQVAGPKAALGKLKFDFVNPYGVYLHDTPSRAKFASFSRLASHGCVRLEKPTDLAKLLLAGDPDWTPEAIDVALEGGKTVRAQLPEQTAVFLLYWTAYVTPDGQVNFRDDPYGWDTLLVQRIAAIDPGSA
ncbi:MAG: Peptidoglycan-binding domain 1 protein [Caulobacter sp.]|nr:Peptidoglycan-binding domain 1 protein [Caulobacter sp.]